MLPTSLLNCGHDEDRDLGVTAEGVWNKCVMDLFGTYRYFDEHVSSSGLQIFEPETLC